MYPASCYMVPSLRSGIPTTALHEPKPPNFRLSTPAFVAFMNVIIIRFDSTVSAATNVNFTSTHFDSIISPLKAISALKFRLDCTVCVMTLFIHCILLELSSTCMISLNSTLIYIDTNLCPYYKCRPYLPHSQTDLYRDLATPHTQTTAQHTDTKSIRDQR